MLISIDYDGTYTRNPALWNAIIELFQSAGNQVICITNRTEHSSQATEVLESIGKIVSQVIFAGTLYKREAAKRAGYKVDVFIDDVPEMCGAPLLIGGS